jgi:hypothetical protein
MWAIRLVHAILAAFNGAVFLKQGSFLALLGFGVMVAMAIMNEFKWDREKYDRDKA